MRLLQLNANGNDSSALDFHPMVTVVTGLSVQGRQRLVDAVTSLPGGGDPGCRGLLEAHGILLDLNEHSLEILDLRVDLDVLIRSSDMPGATTTTGTGVGDPLAPETSVLPPSVARLGVEQFLEITPIGKYPELDEARARQAQSAEALVLLRDAAMRARDSYAEVALRAKRAEEKLNKAMALNPRADLRLVTDEFEPEESSESDQFSANPENDDDGDELDDAVLDLDEWADEELLEPFEAPFTGVGLLDAPVPGASAVESDADEDDGGLGLDLNDPDRDSDDESDDDEPVDDAEAVALDPMARRANLEERWYELQEDIARVDRGIDELAAVDPRPVQVLAEAIRNPGPVEYVPSERGQELATLFVNLQKEVQVLEEGLAMRGMDTPSALARLDASKTALAKAEKSMRPPEYTDQDRIDLEAAHDAVLELERKGRKGSGKKKYEEAIAREQQVLDTMGFPTWSAYVMGAGLMGIDPAAEQQLEKARAEADSADQHWSDVTAMIEADPMHRELLDRLESVYLEAFDLLGGDDESEDLETKLRDLKEPKREVSMEDLLDALAYQLEIVGITLPPEMITLDRTLMVAEAFLEEASEIVSRLNELGDEKITALTELEVIDTELELLPTEEEWTAAEVARGFAEQAAADTFSETEAADAAAEAKRLSDQVADQVAAAEAAQLAAGLADLADEELAEIEREYEVAAEEEVEYAEFVEARDALYDAAIQVESVSKSRLNRLASELAEAEAIEQNEVLAAEFDAGSNSDAADFEGPVVGAHAETDMAFSDVEDVNAGPEAVEFFLLARLAALRAVSYAGSVPLLIDDALSGKPRKEIEQLLHKLERMSESVQIIYISDDETVTRWAEGIGFERAAVVSAPPSFV